MFSENHFIPYNTGSIMEASILVFAPHPDDEIIGMGGTLLKMHESGAVVTIVHVTSGDQGGDAQKRKAEARKVAKAIKAKTIFLDLPDRKVRATDETIQLVSEIIDEISPEAIFFPSPQEYHPDHRVTAALIWAAQKKSSYMGNLYHYEISRQSEVNLLIDVTEQKSKKKELLNLYKSQVTQNNYISVMEALDVARTYTLPKDVEAAEGFFEYKNPNAELLGALRERVFLCLNDPLPKDSPTISILIRTKNRLDTLERALNSVKNQTYQGNIDVVIVNDGGDSVEELAAKFEAHFWRIKVVDVPVTRGRSASANVALLHAEGDFFNFLDDDDEFDPGHIQEFVGNWRRNREIKVLYRGVRVLDAKGKLIRNFNEPFDFFRFIFMNHIPIHAVTFSRELFEIGCRFDESLEYYEDWDFWIQLARLTKFYHSNNITATYHLIGASAASPHMQSTMDAKVHLNKVRDKWLKLCSAAELSRVMELRIN